MAKNQSPKKARRAAKPIFDLDLGLNLELDFDLDDFDDAPEAEEKRPRGKRQRDVRILRPRLDKTQLTQTVAYENAEAFARQIDLTPGARTFAWVSGSFVFGDIVEALITARKVGIRRLYIASLSFSQENVDSLKNVTLLMGDELERLVLVLSGYQYSHEKYGLVPYMYQELDDGSGRFDVAFGGWHCKVITMETVTGHTITIHGSANLRSSNSIEQIMVKIDDRELHDYNAGLLEAIVRRFGTINHDAPYTQLKRIEGKEAWEVATQWQADQSEEDSGAPEAAEDAQEKPARGATRRQEAAESERATWPRPEP